MGHACSSRRSLNASHAVARKRESPSLRTHPRVGARRNQLYKWHREFQARGTGAFPWSGARKERTTKIARLTQPCNGWVAGVLAGVVDGTAVCVTGRGSLKPTLAQIVGVRER